MMKTKEKKRLIWTLTVLAAAAILLTVSRILPEIRRDLREESRTAIRETVIRSAVACYTVNGAYPPNLEYLEEHYGLTVNHRDYIVTYEAFASNVLPTVQVLVRGEE